MVASAVMAHRRYISRKLVTSASQVRPGLNGTVSIQNVFHPRNRIQKAALAAPVTDEGRGFVRANPGDARQDRLTSRVDIDQSNDIGIAYVAFNQGKLSRGHAAPDVRSEERRVGKEYGCRATTDQK